MQILVYVYCEPDLRDMTLGQSHDTPLGYGQQYRVKYYPDPIWQ